jgi:hypothetical protein
VFAGTAALAAVLATGGGARTADTTLTFVEAGGSFRFLDNRPLSRTPPNAEPRLSQGDVVALTVPLYDSSDTGFSSPIGRLNAVCTATKAGRFSNALFVCPGTFTFAQGTLVGIAFGKLDGTVEGAITGGTGTYEGARGSFISTSREGDDAPSDDVVHLID